MRLPKRRSQTLKFQDEESQSRELTPEALERLKQTLLRLKHVDRPKIVADLSHAITLGDFSENAEYQDAKARLSRIDGRIFGLGERIKHAVLIEGGTSDAVRLGSTVTVESNGQQKTYRILGPQEVSPSRGIISHLSPLGRALIGKKFGDLVEVRSPDGSTRAYTVVDLK